MDRQNSTDILNQFKSNDEVFRNTMERIFQRYSNLDDPGVNACLTTMTFKTKKGTMPFNSAEAERELRQLRSRVTHEQSRVMDGSMDEHTILGQDLSTNLSTSQMDVTHTTKTDLDSSSQKETSIDSLWHDSKMSLNSAGSSHSYLLDRPPEEENEELERTLSSHGTTLLDLYPSMINQINESCRRQHVTEAAAAVLRRYRNKRWQSTKSLNGSLSAQKPSKDITSYQKRFRSQAVPLPRSKLDRWPLKSVRNTSFASNDRFYSPRRSDAETDSQTERRSRWTGTHSDIETEHRPVRVLDLSTPSSASSSPGSLSPDLNQTYIVNLVPMQRPHDVRPSAVCSPNHKHCMSPLKEATSPVAGKLGISSPSRKTAGLGREVFREHLYSPNPSQKQAVTGCSSGLRSPLKPQTMSLEQGQGSSPINYPRQVIPANVSSTSEVYGSPYRGQPASRWRPHHPSSDHKENFMSLAEKRQRSLSTQQPRLSDISRMSRKQVDVEFTRLYHHFVCRSISSGSSSSCHLCRLEKKVQSPAAASFSMSALALTPLRGKLKKRRRQSEVEESLRFKRFRESCSPLGPKQMLHQQQASRYASPVTAEPSEDKQTWNTALLLHCPSPGFLRASSYIKKGSGLQLDQQTHLSPSWRAPMSYAGQVKSPMGLSSQRPASLTPSLSRRRLLYGPLQ